MHQPHELGQTFLDPIFEKLLIVAEGRRDYDSDCLHDSQDWVIKSRIRSGLSTFQTQGPPSHSAKQGTPNTKMLGRISLLYYRNTFENI